MKHIVSFPSHHVKLHITTTICTNLGNFGVQIAFLEEFDHAYNACNAILARSQTPIMQAHSEAHN